MGIFNKSEPKPAPASHQPAPRVVPGPDPVPRKSAPAPTPQAAASSAKETTHIASGTKVVGEVDGDAELQIDGLVEGEITLDSRVTIGSGGRVVGKIDATVVEVAGKVIGNVHGRERVSVHADGALEGDVTAPRVAIDDGAFFTGQLKMISKNAQQQQAQQRAQQAKQAQKQNKAKGGDDKKAAGSGSAGKPGSGQQGSGQPASGQPGSGQPGGQGAKPANKQAVISGPGGGPGRGPGSGGRA